MSPDKLVYMANQIGKFFSSQDMAVDGVADHIRKFWEPRMRKEIYSYVDSGGTGLDPTVKMAVQKLMNSENRAKEKNE